LFIFCRVDRKCSDKKICWIIISWAWKTNAMRRKEEKCRKKCKKIVLPRDKNE
jgi:hypothetical protein